MKTKLAAILALSLSVATVAPAAAGDRPAPHKPGPPLFGNPGAVAGPAFGMPGAGPARLVPLLLRSARLTPEQRVKARKIIERHRPTLRRLFGELRKAHEALAKRIFSTEELRSGELAPEINRIEDLRGRLMREGIDVILEVRALLTPEQRARVASAHEKLESLRRQMRELLGEGPLGPSD
ncbi:MAG: periplasmic heavy metal sensor [Candidatus Dadabacteria bacterium]|nr:MAG: periplasmic heavy metal sensor [Candidatus Dadabacteria bacterium]